MKKTLCMLLALILVASALPVNLAAAFAEAGIEVETETDGEVLPVENGEEPDLVVEEPETDLPGENEPQAQAGQEPSAEPAQAEAVRYARALDALSIYKASDLRERHAVLPKESVVLVLEPAETWMRVAVNTQKGVVEGYVAIDAIEVLAGEALERFLDDLAVNGVDALYNDDINLPLATVEAAFDGDAASEPAPQQSAEGEGGEGAAPETNGPVEPATGPENGTQDPDDPSGTPEAEGQEPQGEVQPTAEPTAAPTAEPTAAPTAAPTIAPTAAPTAAPPAAPPAVPTAVPTTAPTAVPTEAPAAEPEDDGEHAVLAAESGSPTEPGDPTDLVLSASQITVGVKEKYALLTATLVPANSATSITWRTSKAKVAKVNAETGVVTGVKAGTAIIYATTANGIEKSCTVTVMKAPSKVTLNTKNVTIAEGGQTYKLTATLPKKTTSTLTYTSSNEAVAKVDASGLITGVAPGSATITVSTFNKKKAKCKVKVIAAPDQVLLPEAITIGEMQHYKLAASVVGVNNAESASTYTFTAENGTGAITVDPATGEVVGVKPGTAKVRVKTYNGVTTHLNGSARTETVCAVTVVEAPVEIRLATNNVSIGVKQTLALYPQMISSKGAVMSGVDYTITSSNKKKLSVSNDGVVKGIKTGTFKVTVKAYNGVSAVCTVKVVKAPSKVTLSPAKPTIGVGQTVKLGVKFPKGGLASYTFSSSDTTTVSVDGEGNITGLKEGSATVTVKTSNGKKAKATVKVSRAPGYLNLNADYDLEFDPINNNYSTVYRKTLNPGGTFQLTYENEYLTYGGVASYQSKNPAVATVSASGLITAVAPGTADIIVKSTGGAEALCRVTVTGTLPASIAFNNADATVRAGQSIAMPTLRGANITAAQLASATYATGNAGIVVAEWVEADAQWKLRGVNAGSTTVTATAAGASATLNVTVTAANLTSTELHFEDATVYMALNQVWKPVVKDEYDVTVNAALTSDKPEIVAVTASGELKGIAEGKAVITATSGSLTAKMTVCVQASGATVQLTPATLKLAVGQRETVKARVNNDGASSNVTYASSNASVAMVNASGVVVARAAGSATITATAYNGTTAICAVTVTKAPSKIALEPASITGRVGDAGVQLKWSFGASDETGTVTFSSSNAGIASVSAAGVVTLAAVGTATVTAQTHNGLTATIDVTVLPQKPESTTPKYRLFAAYSYFDSSYKGYIPFTRNNAESLANTFQKSSISGIGYSTKVMGNPSKTQLLSGISSYFSGTTDKDVSIVYLCSHGHMTGNYTGYRMSLPGYDENPNNANYYLTSTEIFNCISRINGNVILILDSCYSGTFLQDMQGRLNAQGGRIAVMTAASDTRATFYKVKDTNKSVDFFTFFLLQGLGYNSTNHWWNGNAGGSSGSYPGYLAADKAGNNDGIVTLGEFYDFASKSIATNIPKYMKKSWYWGDTKRVQVTRFSEGNLRDLVIYKAG